jgi:hypothetical protein
LLCGGGLPSGRPTSDLADTFAFLREILAAHSKHLIITVDKPGDYQVASPTMRDRIGRPLYVAGVKTGKNYVSYHLMPVYMRPELLKTLSPRLTKRMQGKSCFNFTIVDPDDAKELSAVTKAGIAGFRDLKLPWTLPMTRKAKQTTRARR